MRCPFPGMDPYLERAEIWPDFHDSLIAAIRGALQPLLRPRYAALTQDRLYVIESNRSIRPDVGVIETARPPELPQSSSGSSAVAVSSTVDVAKPHLVFELDTESSTFREPVIHIIEPAAGNRLVTAIEVLSPENKRTGAGRDAYLQKRDEYWLGGANVVEIDLLRAGASTARIGIESLERVRPWNYMVLVTRVSPGQQEVFPIQLRNALPRIPIPLSHEDRDVVLDLQAAFNRCWDEGPYPELLFYGEAPPGKLTEADRAWACSTASQVIAG